jgi:uncharacterized membrane protein
MARPADPRRFLSESEGLAVNTAIKTAERRTSAEVKLVIARHCWSHLKDKASRIFKELGLSETRQHNCVLVLLITTNREFLIYGDQGIHEHVGQGFWDDVRNTMNEAFRQDKFGEGLSQGILLMGEKLAQHFPHDRDDIDEISNEIVYWK